MYSKQEQEQTVVMNTILFNGAQGTTNEEIKNHLIMSGTIEPTDNELNNYIRACVISLNRRFKKFNIERLATRKGIDRWVAEESALIFALEHLMELIYDEEGNEVGKFFQHPVAIEKERLELV
jgi:hypothetical protein